ncbi:MAG TPA: DUF1697 domain-containing protein [Acidimicrobiia bacterium]|nr:DUF1697 domain-containing protein [Acidimicrobiia bacterium]
MTVHIALLRGINVGGKGVLKMSDLRDICAGAGCTDVATYIQSGNVVFSHSTASADSVASMLERALQQATGRDVAVMVRSRAQLQKVVDKNPYKNAEPQTLHVAFLAAAPAAAAINAFDRAKYAPEEFVVAGRDVYLHLPNGVGKTKLLPPLTAKLPAATVRNWNTVQKLLEMAG